MIGRATGQHTVKARTTDNITKRVGLCLQNILKNEYGDAYDGDLTKKNSKRIMQDRNPRLADLTPSQALASLKSELRAFVAKDDPFDRPFRSGETVRQWWLAVANKQFGGILGVRMSTLASIQSQNINSIGTSGQIIFSYCGIDGR